MTSFTNIKKNVWNKRFEFIGTFIIFMMINSATLLAQCIYSPVIAESYFESDCGDKKKQSLIGVPIPIYGNNGSYYFTSPLTNDAFFTSTEEKNLSQLRIYPNPAFDFIVIEWPNSENADIFIYSQLGQLIATSSVAGESLSTIDIQYLPPGYYLIKAVTVTNKIFINKLIKQ
jgi:hypothetical protein